jgi:PAT family beta-lactamase induction signal transducer AmpG
LADPEADIASVAVAAILVGVAGATFDIVIDAYRIELLEPHQLGVGSGMSQYGWRIGAALAGSVALIVAARSDWTTAYIAVSFFGLFAVITGLVMGEPARRQEPKPLTGPVAAAIAYVSPLAEFFKRQGALVVLLFVLVHKIGDTLANLTLRLLFEDLGFTNDELAIYDVGLGFWALLAGIFVGGALYARLGMKRSVLISLVLMAVSNLAFAGLATVGHSTWAMAGAMGFENFASGIGGVCVVAYLSALCNLEFTATQFALLSAAASITGRFLTGTLAGGMIESLGFADFYLVTTVAALPGVLLFWWMMASGLVDRSLGTAGTEESGG